MDKGRTVAVFGTFDVENYGDLLFPLAARRRLSDIADVEFVSPLGNDDLWSDCIRARTTNELISGGTAVDGVLIGGGHVIHGPTGDFTPYNQFSASLVHAYPDIWFGAAYVAAMRECPLLFNAPGVSPVVGKTPFAEFLRLVIDLSEYVNARDAAGAAILRAVAPNASISITPDTALDVAQLWSSTELCDAYRGAFLSRGRSVPKRTLAVHVRKTSLPTKCGPIGRLLDQVAAQTETVPIILSFGRCHDDGGAVREIAKGMRCEPLVLDRPSSLLEVTACLAQSVAYLGSSFHGCLVASAFERPSQLVVRRPQAKHVESSDVLLSSTPPLKSWLDVDPRALSEKIAAGKAGIQSAAFESLDQHWGRIQDVLRNGTQSDKQQEMKAFQARQRAADSPAELSLVEYDSLIEPLKRANLLGLIRRNAHLQRRLDDEKARPKQEKKNRNRKNWIRRLSCALRLSR
jgi:hypothetical protein